jgi:hypothetical protein
VHRLICSRHMVAFKNGPSARREEGAYLNRYVTDQQRSRRPIFKATLRAAASWLFFRVARSTVMIQISALRSRLEKQPTDLRPYASFIRDDALARTGEPNDLIRQGPHPHVAHFARRRTRPKVVAATNTTASWHECRSSQTPPPLPLQVVFPAST